MMSATPPFVVLGSAGFIGCNISLHLESLGMGIIGLCRSKPPWKEDIFFSDRLFAQGDATSISSLKNYIQPGSVIVDCSSSFKPSTAEAAPCTLIAEEVLLLSRRIEIARRCGAEKYIFISSGGAIYGPSPAPCVESMHPSPRTKYGLLKQLCEDVLNYHGRLGGIKCISLRVSNPYGPYHRSSAHGLINVAVRRALAGEAIEIRGNPDLIKKDYVYVSDVCDAVVRVGCSDVQSGVFNVGSGSSDSISDILSFIALELQCDLALKRASPQAHDVCEFHLDIDKIVKSVGFSPAVGLREGVKMVVAWERSIV